MSTVHVLAIITNKPGMRDQVLEAFRANVPNVHAEDGWQPYQFKAGESYTVELTSRLRVD